MHGFWDQLLHVLGVDNVSGKWYSFWSGFGGDIAILAAILAWPWIQIKRHNCQVRHCLRIGRHPYTNPDEHVTRMLCWKHHPDVKYKQITARHLQEHYHLYAGKQPGRG